MTSGGQGRRRNIGDIRAFLKWAVEEKGAPDRWFPINTKAANKYIGVVSKGQKKRGTTPISTRDLELLLESLEHDKEHGMRAICILSAVYGIRVSEIAHMEIKDGDMKSKDRVDYMLPIIADGEAGFGGPLNVFELAKKFIRAGAAGVHFEDQLASEKKCGHMGGKVLVPTGTMIKNLKAARLAADIADVPLIILARTCLLYTSPSPRD